MKPLAQHIQESLQELETSTENIVDRAIDSGKEERSSAETDDLLS